MADSHLKHLHAELDALSGPAPSAPLTLMEALALAGNLLQARSRPRAPAEPRRRGQPIPPPPPAAAPRSSPWMAMLAGGGAAAAAGGAWLLGRRRRRRQQLVAYQPAPAGMLAGWRNRARALREGRRPPPPTIVVPGPAVSVRDTATPPGEITDITRNFILGAVMPIWLAAGMADWWCHRRARIEANAGTKESLIHLLMLAEASIPVIAGMTLEITSPMLLLMFGAVALHSATGLWDVTYAVKRRTVTPVEQHVHSYLEMVPVMATAFITVLHWPELRALLGRGNRAPDWSIRRKVRPLPGWAVATLLTGMAAFEVVPYLEELRRTRRRANHLR